MVGLMGDAEGKMLLSTARQMFWRQNVLNHCVILSDFKPGDIAMQLFNPAQNKRKKRNLLCSIGYKVVFI